MLPHKIFELVKQLRIRTESGSISWKYDDDNGSVEVSLTQPNIYIAIRYWFDTIEEVGAFSINVTDKNTDQNLIFSTTQMYSDFDLVKGLYDSAQASGFNFSF